MLAMIIQQVDDIHLSRALVLLKIFARLGREWIKTLDRFIGAVAVLHGVRHLAEFTLPP
jgi:hypothetical protein